MKSKFFLFMVLIANVNFASADELHLIVSGKAIHYGSGNYNEDNRGFGFEYDFEEKNNWIPLITAVSFLDSNSETSNYIGVGSKRRFHLSKDPKGFHFDAGMLAFVMTRHDYKNNDPFVAALPFVSFGFEWVSLNVTYVPKIAPKMIAFMYFQASVKLLEF